MDSEARREALAERLRGAEGPLSAAALARELNVSRQVIVGDVALLRAGGLDITATPRGYLLPRPPAGVARTSIWSARWRQAKVQVTPEGGRGRT